MALKSRGILIVLFLIVASFEIIPITSVHAISPIQIKQITCTPNVTTCAVTFNSAVATGNVVLCLSTTNNAGASPNTVTCSDGVNTYTNQVTKTQLFSGIYDGAFMASATASTSVALTVTSTSSASVANYYLTIMEIPSIGATASGTATGGCISACTTTGQTSTSVPVDTFDVANFFEDSTSTNAGTGYTRCTDNGAQNCEYGDPKGTPNIPSPTNFPIAFNLGPNRWIDVGAAFPAAATVTVVVPCTFFELQCWWYPLFFMGMYSGFVLLVGTWLRTSPRGKSHLFLSAVTFGSLLAVILGIMNIVFPLLMLLLNTIIALRLRN